MFTQLSALVAMMPSLGGVARNVVAGLLVAVALALLCSMFAVSARNNLRNRRATSPRRRPDPSNQPRGADMVVTLAVATAKLRVTFPVPPTFNGDMPRFGATGGAHTGTEYPTAVTRVSPSVYDLTYAGAVAAANVITIPDRDPAFRNASGGYVVAQTATLA